ncbi:MAG TPA: hypothetical protein VI485_09140 [Vicinamibacterales bacterium]|nr:hypothetical protein [Vicinamibacterales bacterium]
MDFREMLRVEVAQAQKAAEDAQTRYLVLRETLEKYERSADRPTPRKQVAKRALTPSNPKPASRRSPAARRPPPTIGARILSITVGRQQAGVSGPEMVQALKGAGVRASSNVIYSALSKLKKRRAIHFKAGKYYPTAESVKRLHVPADLGFVEK